MSEQCLTWDFEKEWCPELRTEGWSSKHSREIIIDKWIGSWWGETIERLEPEVLVREAEIALEKRFRGQADKWARETAHLSSPTQRIMHPSYQAILGMARENKDVVTRLLLRDLQQNRRPWFWALSYVTQENPIDPKDAGKIDSMIKAWVDWGRAQGLL